MESDDTMKKSIDENCYQCPECSGSGLVGVEDKEGLEYLDCEYCMGQQCFDSKTDDYFFGKCDQSCGYDREQLRKDWQKM